MTTTLNLTAKFEKELTKFIAWVEMTDYKISDIVDGTELEWNSISLDNFEEPGRNKLETYIKQLMKVYFVSRDGNEINDIKLMTKEFREYKPKRSRSDTESESEAKVVKRVKDVKTKKNIKDKTSKKNETFDVVVSDSFDTSDTWYINTLSQSTQDLVNALGEPIKNKNSDDYQYEWKIMVGGKVFSIYNWLNYYNEFYSFEENEWYLGGTQEKSEQEEYLMNYISNQKPKQPSKENEIIKEQTPKEKKTSNEIIKEQPPNEKEIIKEQAPKQTSKQTPKEKKTSNEIIKEQLIENEIEQDIDEDEIPVKESHDFDIELDLIEDDDLEINIDDIDFDF